MMNDISRLESIENEYGSFEEWEPNRIDRPSNEKNVSMDLSKVSVEPRTSGGVFKIKRIVVKTDSMEFEEKDFIVDLLNEKMEEDSFKCKFINFC